MLFNISLSDKQLQVKIQSIYFRFLNQANLSPKPPLSLHAYTYCYLLGIFPLMQLFKANTAVLNHILNKGILSKKILLLKII